jgi:Bacterial SH3 domain
VSARVRAALAAAALTLIAHPVGAADALYVVEQVVVSVNANPDGSGERVASLKSGDRVELIQRTGEEVHVRLADGREGWLRAIYLSGDAPLRPRLQQSEAEVTRLRAEVARLEGQLAAAPKATAPSAAPAGDPTPAEDATAAARQAPLIGTGPDEPRRVWPWALGAVLFGLLVGFALGWRTLDRSIRRKYGGLRIY